MKRVDLIVRALAHVDRPWRLVVVGDGPLRPQLEASPRPRALPIASRSPAAIDDAAARRPLRRRAVAVVFPPYDEDYGYVTLEAFLARKPVVTTTDAGGPLEFVDDGVTGLVAAPDADSLASAMSRIAGQAGLARAAWRGRLRARARHLLGRRRRPPDRGWQPMTDTVSVVIPAFNESAPSRRSSPPCASRRRGARSSSSTMDRATTRARGRPAPGRTVIRHPYNKGNGAAVKTGIRNASGTFVLIADADGQHRPADAARLAARLGEYDLVVGARSSATQASGGAAGRQPAAEPAGELSHRPAHSRSDVGIPRRAPRVPAGVPAPAAQRLLHADDDDAGVHQGRLQRPLRADRGAQRGRERRRSGSAPTAYSFSSSC